MLSSKMVPWSSTLSEGGPPLHQRLLRRPPEGADGVWDELRRHYSEPEIIELAWTIAAYIMLGKLIYAFRIPFDEAEAL